MKILKVSTLIIIFFAVISAVTLFMVSQDVQKTEREIYVLKKSVEQKNEMMRVLNAEWHYLNRPDRLEALAEDHLNYKNMDENSILDNVNVIQDADNIENKHTPSIKINHDSKKLAPNATDKFESVIDNLTYGEER